MKRKLSLLLVISFIFSLFPQHFIFASDFRWIDVEIGQKIERTDNTGTNNYKNGVYYFDYLITTDFKYIKDTKSITARFSQSQLGDRVTKETNFMGRKMRIYVDISVFSTPNPKLVVYDFEFTDTADKDTYDDTITIIEYEDYIDYRRVFYAKNKDNEYVYVAFSTKTGIITPSIYSKDTYKVKYGETIPYNGKPLKIVVAAETTQLDKENKDLYDPSYSTYSGELTSFFMKDKNDNSISYIFTESSGQDQYIVKFNLSDFSQEYYDLNSNTTMDDLNEQLIDEYQEGRKLSVNGYIQGETDNKKIIIVKDFNFLDDNFTRYDKENVFLKVTVNDIVSSDLGRDIYKVKENETNLEYYAIFDKSVLNSSMPKTTLTGKTLTIHGITELKKEKYYIGVLSYGIDSGVTVNNALDTNSNSYNIKEISISALLSESQTEILYKGIDNNGIISSYLFSKQTLGNNMPTSSLLNKTVNIAYTTNNTINTVLAWNEILRENQDYTEKGILINRLQKNDTSVVYNFKNSYGEIIQAILTKDTERELLLTKNLNPDTDTLNNVSVSLFGNIATYDTQRRFVVKDANLLTEMYINKTTADVFTFSGILDSVVSQNTAGITYHAKNSYDQYALIYFSKDTLQENYPKQSLLNKELIIRGLTYSNGIILVTDYNEVSKMNTYPTKIEPLYSEPEHFNNMVGFTGIISLLKAESGKTHLTLITSSQRYLLSFKDSMRDDLESYIGNMVYLRGEPHPVGDPVWSGSIDVYDIAPICYKKGNCDSFIKPVNTPAPKYQDDGQKKAIHTTQENPQLPDEYDYGNGILESLFLPKYIISEEKDFFQK